MLEAIVKRPPLSLLNRLFHLVLPVVKNIYERLVVRSIITERLFGLR